MKRVRWLIPSLFLLAMASLPLLAAFFGMKAVLWLVLGLMVLAVAALSIRIGIGVRRAAAAKDTRRKIMWLSAAALLAGGFIAAFGAISTARSEILWIKNALGRTIVVKKMMANSRVLDATAFPSRIENWNFYHFSARKKNLLTVEFDVVGGKIGQVMRCEFPGNRFFCISEVSIGRDGMDCGPCMKD